MDGNVNLTTEKTMEKGTSEFLLIIGTPQVQNMDIACLLLIHEGHSLLAILFLLLMVEKLEKYQIAVEIF